MDHLLMQGLTTGSAAVDQDLEPEPWNQTKAGVCDIRTGCPASRALKVVRTLLRTMDIVRSGTPGGKLHFAGAETVPLWCYLDFIADRESFGFCSYEA